MFSVLLLYVILVGPEQRIAEITPYNVQLLTRILPKNGKQYFEPFKLLNIDCSYQVRPLLCGENLSYFLTTIAGTVIG